MLDTSYLPITNHTQNSSQTDLVPGDRQAQTRDKLDAFLMITELTKDDGSRYYKPNNYTRALETYSSSTSSNSFMASLNAIERILQDSKFRRGLPPSALQEAQELYADICADCGVAATSGKYKYGRSVQIRQGYEALAGQPGALLNSEIDPRSIYANSLGRSAFSASESTRLSTELGLPVEMIMNPNGYGYNQSILSFILRMTKDQKTYDQLKTDPADEPDGVSKTLSFSDLVKKRPGEFTTAEHHAILNAFKMKTGIDTIWTSVEVNGELVPNEVLLNFFYEEASKRKNPSEKATMMAGVKYLTLSAIEGTRELVEERNKASSSPTQNQTIELAAETSAF